MKAKCEAAHRQFWARSHVSLLLHYYFTGDVFEGTVGKTQLKNRFLLYCKITIRSGICFLELEEVIMPFKSWYCFKQNKWNKIPKRETKEKRKIKRNEKPFLF